MGEIRDKLNWFKELYSLSKAKGGIKWYRIVYFIKSPKGRKRMVRFAKKGINYVGRKITGKEKLKIENYEDWISANEMSADQLIQSYAKVPTEKRTKFSILLNGDFNNLDGLKASLSSVERQVWKELEIFAPKTASLSEEVLSILQSNVKLVPVEDEQNPGVILNSLLDQTNGEFFLSLNIGDELSQSSLLLINNFLVENSDCKFVYTDHDYKINDQRAKPYFKPDWSPQNFLANNYIGNAFACNVELAKQLKGFDASYSFDSSYDFLLRVTDTIEKTGHLAEVGFHLNESNLIAQSDCVNDGLLALKKRSERQNDGASINIKSTEEATYSYWPEVLNNPKVSIIIPSKDKPDLCEVAIGSIFKLSSYQNFEVVLISNNSSEKEFFDMAKKWSEKEPNRFKFIEDNGDFNFARLMNVSAEASSGDHLVLLNNDTEIIQENWLDLLLGYSQKTDVGVVGVKLLYPNDMIQHAGVIVGLGGVANHCFVGLDRNDKGYFNRVQTNCNYSAVTAACFMVSKEIYNSCGGFDEKLAVEFNDVDFCLKVKDAGYNNVYLADVEVYHYESISRGHPHSTRKSFKRSMFEADYFTGKWQKYVLNDPCYNKNLTKIFNDYSINSGD